MASSNDGRPTVSGAQVWMWKHYRSEAATGVRKAYLKLPDGCEDGPKDKLIEVKIEGMQPIRADNLLVEFDNKEELDAVHTFAVILETIINMYRRTIKQYYGDSFNTILDWHWNKTSDDQKKRLTILPHGLPGVCNARYERAYRTISFGYFPISGIQQQEQEKQEQEFYYTCRSLDIVSHETGHAILDGLKPNWLCSCEGQTHALHESFGDLTAIFSTLSQLDQAEAVIVESEGNLHNRSYLANLPDQFKQALDATRRDGLRNADNDLKVSDVTSMISVTTYAGKTVAINDPYDLSLVFTGFIYNILSDIYEYNRRPDSNDTVVLHNAGELLRGLVVRAIILSPERNATFADVAQLLLERAKSDQVPFTYLDIICKRSEEREIVVNANDVMDSSQVQAMKKRWRDTPPPKIIPAGSLERNTPCHTLQIAMKHIQ